MQEKYKKNLTKVLFDLSLYGVNVEIQEKNAFVIQENSEIATVNDEKIGEYSKLNVIIKPVKPDSKNLLLIEAEILVEKVFNLQQLKDVVDNFDFYLSKVSKSVFGIIPESILNNESIQKSEKLMIFVEMPGLYDSQFNRLLYSESGDMLKKMVENCLKLNFDVDCVIMPMIFWRTPGGRLAVSEEQELSAVFWKKAIELVKPKLILVLGQNALSWILSEKHILNKEHGNILNFELKDFNCPLVPMFSLDYLLKNPAEKRIALQDLQNIKGLLDSMN